ncbi:hypothetical protein E2562_026066 [Oryza meyeriana var. granulata]|uniref:Uncharacterized protein n=1 Tax=Oryza meyeriana var. granulata TaxID=110450 RepID=A0A6G1E1T3_9ORYZ|nr:hypothetical protein E2562_026066 [Oryza meyeriana var. granulata]KAF0918758.1 hypothetical protein E2562_026066 [Oryza meyeriana var. granulata]
MDDVWPWLAGLPPPPGVAGEPSSHTVVTLAASPDGTTSIVLQAVCAASAEGDGAEGETTLVDFSLALNGTNGAVRVLWTSGPFAAASSVALRQNLLARLLDEVIELSPVVPCLSGNLSSAPETNLDDEVVAGVVQMAETDGSAPTDAAAASFFSLALLLRLFWLCAREAPADTGFLFFQALGADIERALGDCRPALGLFLRSVGPDVEERFLRSLGYMLAKLWLLREMQAESAARQAPPQPAIPQRALPVACLSYATEVHGLWVLKGYAPVVAMPRVTGAASMPITSLPHEVPEEPALRYGLVHQQLEVVAQLEYAVRARDRKFMTVGVRVDNIRVRVARLGFRKDDADAGGENVDDDAMEGERHFPSRLRLWVGPRFGASYATGPSLGRSTGNPERDVEMTRTVKGAFAAHTKLSNAGNFGVPSRVKAKMRSSARTRNRSWRWEQEAEGSAGVFEGLLCDPVTGTEISSWRAGNGGSAGAADPRNGMRRRYGGPGRAFSKMRGLVVAGDELPEEVTWRVGREAEGRTVPWRLGLKAWVSYLPNEVRSRHFETRCVEWAHEVELPLVVFNGDEM